MKLYICDPFLNIYREADGLEALEGKSLRDADITETDSHTVGFGLLVGFVDSEKNTE